MTEDSRVNEYSSANICERVLGIGDVNSNEPGSGARYNAGKPELAQIPINTWQERLSVPYWIEDVLVTLDNYQRLGNLATLAHLVDHVPLEAMIGACRVFSYGAKKYAQWNWTKGMPFSEVANSLLRHAASISSDEIVDEESGFNHEWHVACNVVMLSHYAVHYPEGADWLCMNDKS